MARKGRTGGVNKSEAIRELLSAKPDMAATEAMKILGDKGISIKPSLFYGIKADLAKGKGTAKPKAATRPARPQAPVAASAAKAPDANGQFGLADIRAIVTAAKNAGGIDQLIEILQAMKGL
jgi:hypothetical protein